MADLTGVETLEQTKRIDVLTSGQADIEILDTTQRHIFKVQVDPRQADGSVTVHVCSSDGLIEVLKLDIKPSKDTENLVAVIKNPLGKTVANVREDRTRSKTYVTDPDNVAFYILNQILPSNDVIHITLPNGKAAGELTRYQAYSRSMDSSLNLASVDIKPKWKACLLCTAIIQEIKKSGKVR